MSRARPRPTAIALLCGLAAASFLWHLGSSSLFLDEAHTLTLARGTVGELLDGVREVEANPPTYFLAVHGWLWLLGTPADWAARLPSALAAIAVVPVAARLAHVAASTRAAVVTALLLALSPLVLGYAQQARAYAPLMLAATAAVLLMVEADRRRSVRWLLGGAVAAALALCLHYLALLVVGPLLAWTARRRWVSRRARAATCAVPVAAGLAWLPLTIAQYRPDHGPGAPGALSVDHVVRVLAAPFDRPHATEASAAIVLGAAVVLGAVAVVATDLVRRRRARQAQAQTPALGLLLACTAVPPAVLVFAAATGRELLLSRYSAVAAPLVVVVVAAAVTSLRRPLAVALLASALAAAGAGTAATHTAGGRLPDTRAAAATIARGWQPGDVVVQHGGFGVDYVLRYYAAHEQPRFDDRIVVPADAPAVATAAGGWVLGEGDAMPPLPVDWRVVERQRFPEGTGLVLVRAVLR